MGCLRLKSGARLDRLSVGGALIVAALFRTALELPFDLVITSGTDGDHSGPTDPHKRGSAVDVRSHNLTSHEKDSVFNLVNSYLSAFTTELGADGRLEELNGGQATALFFGFLESPNEHFHWQVRRGQVPRAPIEERHV